MNATAPFRNPYYHKKGDTVDKLDFVKMSVVAKGTEKILESLAGKIE